MGEFLASFWGAQCWKIGKKLLQIFVHRIFFFSPQPFYKTNIKHYLLTFLRHTSTYQFHIKKKEIPELLLIPRRKFFLITLISTIFVSLPWLQNNLDHYYFYYYYFSVEKYPNKYPIIRMRWLSLCQLMSRILTHKGFAIIIRKCLF